MFGNGLMKKNTDFIDGKFESIYDELNTTESILISSRTFKSKRDADALPNIINALKVQLERRKKTYNFNNAIEDLKVAHNLALEVCNNLRCTVGNRNERRKIKHIRELVERAEKAVIYELDGKLDQR